MTIKLLPEEEKKYRQMSLHSMFSSLFWGVIQRNRGKKECTIDEIARKTGYSKQRIMNLFSSHPQWSCNAIFYVAEALNLELIVEARERSTGKIYTPHEAKDESN